MNLILLSPFYYYFFSPANSKICCFRNTIFSIWLTAVVAAYAILNRDQSVVNAAIKSVTKAINKWEHTAVAKEDRADLNRSWNEVTWSIQTSQLPNIST